MGTTMRRVAVLAFCLFGVMGVGCSSDDHHHHHHHDRWDDRRGPDWDGRPGPRGPRYRDCD